jgi:hypothetical protein
MGKSRLSWFSSTILLDRAYRLESKFAVSIFRGGERRGKREFDLLRENDCENGENEFVFGGTSFAILF